MASALKTYQRFSQNIFRQNIKLEKCLGSWKRWSDTRICKYRIGILNHIYRKCLIHRYANIHIRKIQQRGYKNIIILTKIIQNIMQNTRDSPEEREKPSFMSKFSKSVSPKRSNEPHYEITVPIQQFPML